VVQPAGEVLLDDEAVAPAPPGRGGGGAASRFLDKQPMDRLLFALCLACLAAACARPAPERPHPVEPFDLIIEGGRIVDGTGNPWFYGDVAVAGDRIVRVAPAGRLAGAPARERIDAADHVVAPGFIDIQSHSRSALLSGDSRVLSKITQGITTEILGEGTTDAPINPRRLDELGLDDMDDPDRRRLYESFAGTRGFDAWLRAMEERGVSPNVGSFLGASTVRHYARGLESGPSSPAELDTMRAVVRRAMEDGAFGIASALINPPGSYASTDELVELSRAMAPYGGVYITHMRSEADALLEALDEAIEIGRRAGVRVEIYHLKAAGERNWAKTEPAIARIEAARAAGLDVAANMYPYTAGGTGLTACLPPWTAEGGGLYERLRDPATRARVHAEMLAPATDWENLCGLATPDRVLVLGLRLPEHEAWIGRRLVEIAETMETDWADAALRLIAAEEQRIGTIYFLISDENVALKMRQPWISFGTDAGGFDPDSATALTHPRAYGTYPRILGRFVREQRVISLEEAVRKMTSAVANRLSIQDRGLLHEGLFADIVVFDPHAIRDRATFEDPHQLSVGVRHVFVNGVAVLRDGRHTGATPGRIVRGPGYRP
jgi:N-acyl-D-amino-acid deacylase